MTSVSLHEQIRQWGEEGFSFTKSSGSPVIYGVSLKRDDMRYHLRHALSPIELETFVLGAEELERMTYADMVERIRRTANSRVTGSLR